MLNKPNPMRFNTISFLYLCLCTFLSFGQEPVISSSVTKIIYDKELEEDGVLYEESFESITFEIDKYTKLVKVQSDKKDKLLSTDDKVTYQKYYVYDSQTVIKEFKCDSKNKHKVKDEAYTSNDLFHNDTRVRYLPLHFSIKGQEEHFHSIVETKDIKYFTKVFLNEDKPAKKKTVVFTVPNWLDISLTEYNFDGYDISKKIETNQEKEQTIYTYTITNVDGFYDEENALGPSYIFPHLLIHAKSFEYEGETITLFEETKDLYAWYYSLINSLENKNEGIVELVNDLLQGISTDQDKIKKIYYWVQDNIRYIAFEDGIAGYKPDEAENVLSKKYGDCKGMANLTKQMLIAAGLDARLSWIGTKRIPYDYSIPNLAIDNHMICTVFLDGSPIYLDATESFVPLFENANRIQDKQVLIENGKAFLLETIPSTKTINNTEVSMFKGKIENDVYIGSATKEFTGESRADFIRFYHSLKSTNQDDFLKHYLTNGTRNIKARTIITSDLENREGPITISYDIAIENNISSFDNEIYIDFEIDRDFEDYLFEDRKSDYAADYAKTIRSVFQLEIPVEYSVSYLPKAYEEENEFYRVSLDFISKNNRIIYTKNFTLKTGRIPLEYMDHWNQLIEKVKETYNEQIVLKKKI